MKHEAYKTLWRHVSKLHFTQKDKSNEKKKEKPIVVKKPCRSRKSSVGERREYSYLNRSDSKWPMYRPQRVYRRHSYKSTSR